MTSKLNLNFTAKPELKKTRVVYTIDNPFCLVQWPPIDPADGKLMLELLCPLLTPIGEHRTLHIRPSASKGKRARRAQKAELKRQKLENSSKDIQMSRDGETGSKEETAIIATLSKSNIVDLHIPTSPPPPPEISDHILLGLNSITNTLTLSSTQSTPSTLLRSNPNHSQPPLPLKPKTHNYLSLLFVTRADSQPSLLHQHLPMQVYLSSLNPLQPTSQPTLLIALPKDAASQLSLALGVPRVSFIGLTSGAKEISPIATRLEELCRERVEPVKVPFLESQRVSRENAPTDSPGEGIRYQPMRVKKLLTTIGTVPDKRKGKNESQNEKEDGAALPGKRKR